MTPYGMFKKGAAIVSGSYASGSNTSSSAAGKMAKRRRFGPSNKKRQLVHMDGGNELTRSKRQLTMHKYKLSKLVNMQFNQIKETFRGVTNFDTNVGYFPCYNYIADNGTGWYPMVVFNLTQKCPPSDTSFERNVALRYGFSATAKNTPLETGALAGQTANGTGSTQFWQPFYSETAIESGQGTNNVQAFNKLHLDYISARFNLYGARNRDTRWTISLVSPIEEEQDFIAINTDKDNSESKLMLQELTRQYIWSNLQQDTVKGSKRYLKVLKEWEYKIPASNTTDIAPVGKIHEANIFMKLNRVIDYAWTNNVLQVQDRAAIDGPDWAVMSTTLTANQKLPKPNLRLYLVVRAFAPVATNAAAPSANDPSFDLILNRKFRYNTTSNPIGG